MPDQRTLLFALPENRPAPRMDASDWRAAFVVADVGQMEDWNKLRVVAVQHMLWVIAGSTQANEWIDLNLDAIAGVVADVCAGPAALEVAFRHVGVRAGGGRLWAYRIPSMVVDKGGGEWKEHINPPLSEPLVAKLKLKIESSVRRELAIWDALPLALAPDKPFFVVTDPGRGMIVPGIHADRSGHGKPVNVLLRRHVRVLSPLRIDGNIFAGALNSLGHGRLLRTQAPEIIERATQIALTDMPTFEEYIE